MGSTPTTTIKSNKDPKFFVGILTGLLILAFGTVTFIMEISKIWELTFCTGFGIILASFGTSADIKYKGITIAGAGAIAVIFYLLITQFEDCKQITYASIYTHGKFHPATQIEVLDKEELLGALKNDNLRYMFVIEGNELSQDHLDVSITDEDKKEYFFNVKEEYIEPFLKKGEPIQWVFNKKKGTLVDKKTKALLERMPGAYDEDITEPIGSTSFFVTSSFASELGTSYEELFDALLSDQSRVRRESRTKLAEKGLEGIKPMMKRLKEDYNTYRTRLGIIYTLRIIYKQQTNGKKAIKARLTEEDIELLVKTTNDEDKTIRTYATSFLESISDHRAIEYALEQIKAESSNIQGKYNAVFIIKNLFNEVSDEKKRQISEELTSVSSRLGPQTNKLINSFILKDTPPLLHRTTKKPYFVIVGSFTELGDAKRFADHIIKKSAGHKLQIRLAINGYYGVILGERVDSKEAKSLIELAKDAGIAKDAYIYDADDYIWGEDLF